MEPLGTISCIVPYSDGKFGIYFEKTFAMLELDYQKKAQRIARIDWQNLKNWMETILKKSRSNYNRKYKIKDPKVVIVMERPMINAERFKQSKNAARAFESTIMVLVHLNPPSWCWRCSALKITTSS